MFDRCITVSDSHPKAESILSDVDGVCVLVWVTPWPACNRRTSMIGNIRFY